MNTNATPIENDNTLKDKTNPSEVENTNEESLFSETVNPNTIFITQKAEYYEIPFYDASLFI